MSTRGTVCCYFSRQQAEFLTGFIGRRADLFKAEADQQGLRDPEAIIEKIAIAYTLSLQLFGAESGNYASGHQPVS